MRAGASTDLFRLSKGSHQCYMTLLVAMYCCTTAGDVESPASDFKTRHCSHRRNEHILLLRLSVEQANSMYAAEGNSTLITETTHRAHQRLSMIHTPASESIAHATTAATITLLGRLSCSLHCDLYQTIIVLDDNSSENPPC